MTGLAASLRAAISGFDGKAMTLLGEAEAAHGSEPGYIEALIDLVADAEPMVGSGSTWLIKSRLENDGALSAKQASALIAALPKGEGAHWSTQLHLCQSIRFISFTAAEAAACKIWLTPLLTHKRPFVRAWSLDALAHLAKAHKEHRADFEAALKQASADGAASVRARARGLG